MESAILFFTGSVPAMNRSGRPFAPSLLSEAVFLPRGSKLDLPLMRTVVFSQSKCVGDAALRRIAASLSCILAGMELRQHRIRTCCPERTSPTCSWGY